MWPSQSKAANSPPAEKKGESRTMEALKMKDEQLRILTEQNTSLLKSLDNLEEEMSVAQEEKLRLGEECRKLKDENFEFQSKGRTIESALKNVEKEVTDRDKKIQIMTSQNSELLRLLETEESQTTTLEREKMELRDALEALKGKYSSLLTTAKTHEEIAGRAAREGQLRAEELRLLRSECEQLRIQNAEMERKSSIEIESLQEQLRIRKEKQYHLLEQMQGAEESKRQAEDQTSGMTEKLRSLHSRTVELETQLQVETRAKRNQEEANRSLSVTEENLRRSNAELQDKVQSSEKERSRMEAEARDSSEQLREMAEKVFQLLERLKLAELGKSKTTEQLRKCEQELLEVKKKCSRLLKESTEEGKQRVKAELDKKTLLDQIRSLKTHNAELTQRCRDEVQLKLKEHEERMSAEEKVKTLGGRISFLLNKLQADEEFKVANQAEIKKMEAQIKTLHEKSDELVSKLNSTGESNRIITQAMRLKQQEVEALQMKYAALMKTVKENKDGDVGESRELVPATVDNSMENDDNNNNADEPSADQVRAQGGRGRFYLDAKPTQGFVLLRAKRASAKKLLERYDINEFLKRAQKSQKFKELIVEKIGHILGLLNVEEEDHKTTTRSLENRVDQIDHLTSKLSSIEYRLSNEEEAKRRTLLRYVQIVKSVSDDGALRLNQSGVGDEEMHALAAMVRGSTTIHELHLQNNSITDGGARPLAALLAGPPACHVRFIDLRNNNLTPGGIKIIAEALERAQNTRHVYVHAGGKIEALGTRAGNDNDQETTTSVNVETVCEVDVRDQGNKSAENGSKSSTSTLHDVADAPPRAIENVSTPKGGDGKSKGKMKQRKSQSKDLKIHSGDKMDQNRNIKWKSSDISNASLPPLASSPRVIEHK